MIEVKNVEKSFGNSKVLKGISTIFETGKTNLIIGQSGSGKTVLLKSLLGIHTPEKGTISFDGRIYSNLSANEKQLFKKGHEVYFRDAHCATCHQANGKGLAPAFPPLNNSPWVTGDTDRLIKLTLHGLMGPLEINGQKFDGAVPMTPFGGILKDDEVAGVLTYVRNQFGNKAPAITPQDVKRVRDATKGQKSLFLVEELLKQHPMK
jgi:mono/diheme cytochrome c family protein